MKINWGTGIVIFIVLFVSGMALLVFISFNQKINLVHEDYYPMEIEHQKMIDKENNTAQLRDNISFELAENSFILHFPTLGDFSQYSGTISLYRPSDYEQDIEHKIALNDKGEQEISTKNLLEGKYVVKVDWEFGGKAYFAKKNIHLGK